MLQRAEAEQRGSGVAALERAHGRTGGQQAGQPRQKQSCKVAIRPSGSQTAPARCIVLPASRAAVAARVWDRGTSRTELTAAGMAAPATSRCLDVRAVTEVRACMHAHFTSPPRQRWLRGPIWQRCRCGFGTWGAAAQVPGLTHVRAFLSGAQQAGLAQLLDLEGLFENGNQAMLFGSAAIPGWCQDLLQSLPVHLLPEEVRSRPPLSPAHAHTANCHPRAGEAAAARVQLRGG